MFNKKGAEPAGLLGFFIFGGLCLMILIGALYVIDDFVEGRAKASVTENIAEFNDNVFLFNYLRYPVEEKTMADLVIKAYIEDDKELLRQETMNFFNELYSQEAEWQIYINDELFVNNLHIMSEEKTIHEAYIPNYYALEPIKFKFVFY